MSGTKRVVRPRTSGRPSVRGPEGQGDATSPGDIHEMKLSREVYDGAWATYGCSVVQRQGESTSAVTERLFGQVVDTLNELVEEVEGARR
jgi:sigma54-dependent transcription regulator